jgi:hypothetical protein
LIEAKDGLETYVSEKGWRVCQDVIGEVDNEDMDAQDEWEPVIDDKSALFSLIMKNKQSHI